MTSRINWRRAGRPVNSAIQEGRLIPSMEPWAREYGAKDVAGLKSYLGQAKPIAALTQRQSAGRTSVPTSVDQLDEAALAVLLGHADQAGGLPQVLPVRRRYDRPDHRRNTPLQDAEVIGVRAQPTSRSSPAPSSWRTLPGSPWAAAPPPA
ncbi:phage protease [Pseudomonas aeruginosa]|uniref:phage protease n=1 Tax=Pseudomonas aeruginosa TaxID=287 RepID=UPI0030F04630